MTPSLLTWIFSPAASAPLLPDTTSVVSLVMKSLLVPPIAVSVAIAVIASVSAGAVVSMVMAWLVVVPILPAVSTIRAV